MDEDTLIQETQQSLPMVNNTINDAKIQELESRIESVEMEVKSVETTVESLPMINQGVENTVGNTDQSQIINQMLNNGEEEPQTITEQLTSEPEETQELPSQNIQKPARTATVVQQQSEQGIVNTLKTLFTSIQQSFVRAIQETKNKENELVDTDKETQAELKRSDEKTINAIANTDLSVHVKDEPKNTFHWTDALMMATPIIIGAAKKIWQGIGQCLMNVISFVGPIVNSLGFDWNYQGTMSSLASYFGVPYSSPQTVHKEEDKRKQQEQPQNKNETRSSKVTEPQNSPETESKSSSGNQTSTPSRESGNQSQQSQSQSSGSSGQTTPEKEQQKSSTPLSSGSSEKITDAEGDSQAVAQQENKGSGTTSEPSQSATIDSVTNNSTENNTNETIKKPKTSEPVKQEESSGSWFSDLFGIGGILGPKVTDEQARQHGFVNAEEMKKHYKLKSQGIESSGLESLSKDKVEHSPESKNNINARKIQDERNAQIAENYFSNESSTQTNNLELNKKNKSKNNQQKQQEENKEYMIALPSAKNFPMLNKNSYYRFKPKFFKPA